MLLPARLSEGYRAFIETRLPLERSRCERLAATGQRPDVMVIGCCDSRVSPEVIFDSHPGEIFVVRNVANLVPPYRPDAEYHGSSAAIEFAVRTLKVADPVALGHSGCGGSAALLRGGGVSDDSIAPWLRIAAAASVARSAVKPACSSAKPSSAARSGSASTTSSFLMTSRCTFPLPPSDSTRLRMPEVSRHSNFWVPPKCFENGTNHCSMVSNRRM